MAARKRDNYDKRTVGETVKAYKVVAEFDGCDERHYAFGEVLTLAHWPDWVIVNALGNGFLEETWIEDTAPEPVEVVGEGEGGS